MGHEGTEQVVLALQRPAVMPRGVQQRVEVKGREVGERIHFQVTPNVLNGIEFRGIRGKEMGMQSRLMLKESASDFGTVSLEAVPDQDNGAVQFLQEHAEKADDGLRVYVGVRVKPEIQVNIVPCGRHPKGCNGRHFLMRPRVLMEQRRLAAWTPRPANQRSHQHAALVNEHQPSLQARGFF